MLLKLERPEQNLSFIFCRCPGIILIFSSVSDFFKTLIDRKSPMIQSFGIFNGNNFPDQKVFYQEFSHFLLIFLTSLRPALPGTAT